MFKRIYIEITNVCNLKCSFCKGSNREKKYMTSASFRQVLKKIEGYTEYICLHLLGEPLMHPELSTILDIAHQYKMKVNLTTNGRLLSDNIDVINKAQSIRQINISLHSFKDIKDIEEILNVVDMITLDCYISLRLWNLGADNENKDIIELINNHYQVNVPSNVNEFVLRPKLYLNFDQEFEWPDIKNKELSETGTCYGLRNHIGILVDGTVVPCCLDSDGIINLGNIFKEDLASILNSYRCQKMKEGFQNRKLIEPLCKRCHYIERFDKKTL